MELSRINSIQENPIEGQRIGGNIHEHQSELITEIESVLTAALRAANELHDSLGQAGLESTVTNQFGEQALRLDWEIEQIVIAHLQKAGLPIRVRAEEHGVLDLGVNPTLTCILDGLDGSTQYRSGRNVNRYGSMVGVFSSLEPTYADYLSCAVCLHSPEFRLFVARKNRGAFEIVGTNEQHLTPTAEPNLTENSLIYFEPNHPVNAGFRAGLLEQHQFSPVKSLVVAIVDVVSGQAALLLDSTHKHNLEQVIGFAFANEVKAVMVTLDRQSLAERSYLYWGQDQNIPYILAANNAVCARVLAD